MKKAKAKLKALTARSQGRNVRKVMENVRVYICGWLGYFGIASMKTTMRRWDEWLRCSFRMYIWKQWKNPGTRVKNLMKLGLPAWRAREAVYSGKAYWRAVHHPSVQWAISNKRLAQAGYYSILDRYPDGGIAPGTKWEDIPEDFECPLCLVGKDQFSEE